MTEESTPKSNTDASSPSSPNSGATPVGGLDYSPDFGKQYDRSGWTLPVVGGVLIGALVLGFLGFLVYAYLGAKQPGLGGIESVTAVELGDQKSVLVAVTLHVTNRQDRPFYIEHIQGKLETAEGQLTDDAAAASDHARYFEAFPALRVNVTTPLKYDDKLQSGQQVRGTVVFSFPVTKAQFDQRKSLSVLIQPHGMRLITIAEDQR